MSRRDARGARRRRAGGGFVIVPRYGMVQQRSSRALVSRIQSANSIVNARFMVAAAAVGALALETGCRCRSGCCSRACSTPALRVCNHVSYVDAIVIPAACRRPVLRTIFRGMPAVQIAPRSASPEVYEWACATVERELAANR